jgi:hypothetical protein
VILALFVFLCAVIAAYSFLTDSARVRNMAEGYLSALSGDSVHIGGAELTLFEGLRLDNVVVRVNNRVDPNPILFSAESVQIKYDPAELLQGRLAADQIVAVDARVRLTEDVRTHQWNYQRTPAPASPSSNPSPQTAPAAPPQAPPAIPEVLLRNARIDYAEVINGKSVPRGSIQIEGQLEPTNDDDAYRFNLQSRGADEAGPLASGVYHADTGGVTAELRNFVFGPDIKAMLPPEVRSWWEAHELNGAVDIPRLSYEPTGGTRGPTFLVETDLKHVTLSVRSREWMAPWQNRARDEAIGPLRALRQLASRLTASDTGDGGALLARLGFNPVGVAGYFDAMIAAAEPAPIRLSDCSGKFVFTDDGGIRINNVAGYLEGARLQVSGVIGGYSPDAPIDLTLRTIDPAGLKIPHSPSYLTALPDQVRDVYDVIHPEGVCRGWFRLLRDKPNEGPQFSGDFDVSDASVCCREFPYPIQGASGHVTIGVDPRLGFECLKLMNIRGYGLPGGPNANTLITADGFIGPLDDTAGTDILVTADHFSSEPALMKALPPPVKYALSMFDPEAKGALPTFCMNLAADVRSPIGMTDIWHVDADIDLTDFDGRFAAFPYPLRHLSGKLKVRDGFLGIDAGLDHSGGRLGVKGAIHWSLPAPRRRGINPFTAPPQKNTGGARPDLQITATNVPVDADLVRAMQPQTRAWLRRLGLGGRIDVAGRIYADIPGAPAGAAGGQARAGEPAAAITSGLPTQSALEIGLARAAAAQAAAHVITETPGPLPAVGAAPAGGASGSSSVGASSAGGVSAGSSSASSVAGSLSFGSHFSRGAAPSADAAYRGLTSANPPMFSAFPAGAKYFDLEFPVVAPPLSGSDPGASLETPAEEHVADYAAAPAIYAVSRLRDWSQMPDFSEGKRMPAPIPDGPTVYDLAVDLHDGTLWPPDGTFAISQVGGQMHVSPGRFEMQRLVGKRGDADFTGRGLVVWQNGAPQTRMSIAATNLALDPPLYNLLPATARQGWDGARPEGVVDATVDFLTPPIADAANASPNATAAAAAAGTNPPSPAPVPPPAPASPSVAPLSSPAGSPSSTPLSPPAVASLTSASGSPSFAPASPASPVSLDPSPGLSAGDFADQKPGVRVVIRPLQLTLTPREVPYRLDDVKGIITIDSGLVTLEHITASHGAARLAISGVGQESDQTRWNLKLAARDLPIDDDLRRAAPPALGSLMKSLSMSGHVALNFSKLVYRSNMPAPPPATPPPVSLPPDAAAEAAAEAPATATTDPTSARPPAAAVQGTTAAATATAAPSGPSTAQSPVSGATTSPDAAPVVALADNPDVDFDVGVQSSDAALDVGIPITALDGGIKLSGSIQQGRIDWLKDDLAADSLLMAGRKATNFSARLEKPSGEDAIRLGAMRVNLCGGSAAGEVDASYPQTGPSRYAMNFVLRDADVQDLARPGDANIQGRLSASMTMEGEYDRPDSRRGRGDVTMHGKDMYHIPLLLGLLQVTNLSLPISSPFNDASARYSVDGQQVALDNISLQGDNMSMSGGGSLDFDTKKVRLTFMTNNPGWLNMPVVGPIFQTAHDQLLQIHVNGTLQKPEVSASSLDIFSTSVDEVLKADDKK